MSYLIDTDVVADFLNGNTEAARFLKSIAGTYPAISIITFGEIYEGIYFGRDPVQNEEGFLDFLNGVDVLPLDAAIMQRFAMVRGGLRRQGQLIPDSDLLIAATALHFDLPLVTRNERHFRRVPGLELVLSFRT